MGTDYGASRSQRVTALGGLVAIVLIGPVVVWTFGRSVLPWVLFAAGLIGVALVAAIAIRRVLARRFPVMAFDLDDVSVPAAQIEQAKARLAGGDYAAFIVNAVPVEDVAEASGQIWYYAAKGGGIERTSVELSYESTREPAENPALSTFVSEGFEITRWEPGHWVLLTLRSDLGAAKAIGLVADSLIDLFQVEASTRWTVQAFA